MQDKIGHHYVTGTTGTTGTRGARDMIEVRQCIDGKLVYSAQLKDIRFGEANHIRFIEDTDLVCVIGQNVDFNLPGVSVEIWQYNEPPSESPTMTHLYSVPSMGKRIDLRGSLIIAFDPISGDDRIAVDVRRITVEGLEPLTNWIIPPRMIGYIFNTLLYTMDKVTKIKTIYSLLSGKVVYRIEGYCVIWLGDPDSFVIGKGKDRWSIPIPILPMVEAKVIDKVTIAAGLYRRLPPWSPDAIGMILSSCRLVAWVIDG